MSELCERVREMIAEWLLAAPPAETRGRIEEHLRKCPACRAYADAVREDDAALASLAESLEPSVARVERRVMAALGGDAVENRQHVMPFWRFIMNRRIAAVAAAIVVVAAVILVAGLAGGLWRGPAPAFAEVVATIDRARNVSFRQLFMVQGIDTFATEEMVNERGIVRSVMEDGTVRIIDYGRGLSLQYGPHARKAILERRTSVPAAASRFNWLTWYRGLYRESAKYVGSEKMDGRKTNVFVIDGGEFYTTTIWADAGTNLPVRIVRVTRRDPNLEVAVPSISLPISDFGGSGGETRSIQISGSWGMQYDAEYVYDDFRWNETLDDSLFDLAPPDGYALEELRLDVSDEGEKELVRALVLWTDMSGGAFPATIADLGDAQTVRAMLKRKHDRNGDPGDELDRALRDAHQLLKGLSFAIERKASDEWHYAGAGLTRRDARKPVCWWKIEGDRYRVLRADLSIVDAGKSDLPAPGN